MRRRTGRMAAVAVILIYGVVGCGAPQGHEASAPYLPPVPPPRPGTALPLDAYQPSPDQQARSDRAQATLERVCLARFGLRWEGPEKTALEFGPRAIASERADRFGVVDQDEAARYGYRPPPWSTRNPQVRAALTGHHHSPPPEVEKVLYGLTPEHEGRRVPDGGCRAEAAKELMRGAPPADRSLPLRLAQQVAASRARDPRLAQALRAWNTCMARLGHPYASPAAAAQDRRWKHDAPPTEAERNVARADVRCRHETRYLPTLIAVTAKHQRELITRHALELGRLKRLEDIRARNVAAVLSA
ncbi:hypothetical protein [Streptomyces sp. NPDC088864]|uniref:hypothetical protein n=1 Tax=Streptomyces sp. NPDC088864 TaxID=3365910 RepID=UPI0037FDF939